MSQVDGPAVNSDAKAQGTAIIAPFPIRLALMTISAQALKIVWVSLKVTVTVRSPNVIDLCCDLNVAAEFTVLAKRASAQGLRARNLAPVSRAVICAIGIEGRAVTHVDLPVLARVVPAGGAGRSPLPCAKMAALDHHLGSRLPSDRWSGDARRSWATMWTCFLMRISLPSNRGILLLIFSYATGGLAWTTGDPVVCHRWSTGPLFFFIYLLNNI